MQAGKLVFEEAIDLFRCLRDTTTLSDWQQRSARILQTEAVISSACQSCTADPGSRAAIAFKSMLDEYPMLHLQFSAAGRGLQLLQQQANGSSGQLLLPLAGTAVKSVALLCSVLSDCLFVIYLTTPPGPMSTPYKVKLATAMAGSGLFPGMASACSLTATTLQQQQQQQVQAAAASGEQQQQQEAPGSVELLSCALLSLWRACARLWPLPNLLRDRATGPTVQPAAALAVAVLERWPGPAPSSGSKAGKKAGKRASKAHKSSDVQVDPAEALRSAAFEANCLADKLAFILFDELIAADQPADTPVLRRLVTAPEVQRLLIINTACVAQRLHTQLKGRSAVPVVEAPVGDTASSSSGSSSKKQQQMAAPTYHENMLSALGLEGLDTAALKEHATGTEIKRKNTAVDGNEHNSMVVSVIAVLHMTVLRMDSSSSTNSGGAQQVPGLSGTPLPLPLLKLLVEAQLLAPEVEHSSAGLQLMQLVVQAHHLDMPPASADDIEARVSARLEWMMATAGNPAAAVRAPSAPAPAPADVLLPPVFQLLAPVVLYVLKESGQDNAEEVMVARRGDKVAIMHQFAVLVRLVMLPTSGDMLAYLFRQQPLLVSTVVDVALRAVATNLKPLPAAAPTHGPAAAAAFEPPPLLDRFVDVALRPWIYFLPVHWVTVLSGAAAAGTDIHTVLLQVFSILMSGVKVAAAAAGSRTGAWQHSRCIEKIHIAMTAASSLHIAVPSVLPGPQSAATAGASSRKSGSKAAASRVKASSSGSGGSSSSDDSSQLSAVRGVCWVLVVSRGLYHISGLALLQLEAAQRDSTINEELTLMTVFMREALSAGKSTGEIVSNGSLAAHLSVCDEQVRCLEETLAELAADDAAQAVQADVQELQLQRARVQQALSDFKEQHLQASPAPTATEAGMVEQLQALMGDVQQLAAGLCVQLPVRHCCNNPTCLNLARLSELQLVGGRGCICGGCKIARFCGKSCQEAAWKAHKPVCKRLKQSS